MTSLTHINRRKRCVNIPRSKKGAHEHTHKCGLSVRAKRLHTPGEQDIGGNDRNSLKGSLNFQAVGLVGTIAPFFHHRD